MESHEFLPCPTPLMEGTQPSYTYALGVTPRTYRGIIRRRTDGGGIWECWDTHATPTEARECAQREWRRRIAAATAE